MSAWRRKTLVVCRNCHEKIQYGRYDGKALSRKDYWKATCSGNGHGEFGGGRWEKYSHEQLAGRLPYLMLRQGNRNSRLIKSHLEPQAKRERHIPLL